jgi:hypothetical protein
MFPFLHKLLELSVKSCPVGGELLPSFDASSSPLISYIFEDGYGRGEGEGMKNESFHPNHNQKPM